MRGKSINLKKERKNRSNRTKTPRKEEHPWSIPWAQRQVKMKEKIMVGTDHYTAEVTFPNGIEEDASIQISMKLSVDESEMLSNEWMNAMKSELNVLRSRIADLTHTAYMEAMQEGRKTA